MAEKRMKNRTEFIRVEKNKNYTTINNEFLKRNDLSWKAKGILAYILHLPNDWSVNLSEIMTHATEGERAFRSGWKELEEHGYVKRYPVRAGQRISHWETIVNEKPNISNTSLDCDNSKVEKSIDVKGSSELSCFVDVQSVDVQSVDVHNVELLSTKDTKYLNKLSTNNTNKPSPTELEERFNELWKLYPIKKSRKTALAAYKKANKAGVKDEEIKTGIENYKKEIEIKRTDEKYIAHGSTWFNQERWNDDYETNTNPNDVRGYDDASEYENY